MSKIFPSPGLYWEGSVENQALRAPGQEAFLWFSSLCTIKATSVPFWLKNVYRHLAYLDSKDYKEHVYTVWTCWKKNCRSADYFLVLWEETACALYEDVGTICTVNPQPHAVKHTEKRLNGQNWYKYPQQGNWEFVTFLFYGDSVRLSGQLHPTRWSLGSHCTAHGGHSLSWFLILF